MNSELQAMVEYMERERGIDKETMVSALEDALLSASKRGNNPNQDLRVEIDRSTYNIRAWAKVEVVQNARSKTEQVSLQKAKEQQPDVSIGDLIEIEVDTMDFGRISAQTAKQAILQRIRQAEKEHGPQIVLSRSHPSFVRRLFELEVSEIADGTVEIKGIAREAGFRTKIAVLSHDEKVDPVGACVGMRGIRVKNIVRELSGEKIDIVRWHDDVKTFVTNALAPARLNKVTVDANLRAVEVVVDGDQLSLAIGKKGQNARLTAKLTGWKIDIQKNEEHIGFEEKVARAVAELAAVEGIGEELAEKLVHAGFLTLEGILAAELDDLQYVEGLAPEVAQQIHDAAEAAYEQEHGKIEA